MKKFTLLTLLCALVGLAYGQTRVGLTFYDLQTNNSSCRRVAVNASGEAVITYTRSMSAGITPGDRGTGYNYWDGSAWQTTTFGTTFTRPDLDRTGWPNVVFTRSGREVVVSHFASASVGDGLQVMYRDLGTTGAWTHVHLDDNPDATWARAANKGDSIFVINGNFGDPAPVYNGVNGGIQMWRSFDGGTTWTGPDSIPGINGTNFASIGGDSYALDVNENGTVAIVAGDFHTQLWKSTDFGDTWSQTIVNASPNPTFSGQAGEILSATDTLDASDGSFSVLLDASDVAHVWYGKQVVFDDDPAEGWSFFPFDNGLMYWNEGFTGDPVQLQFSEFLLGESVNGTCGALVTNPYSSGAGAAPQPYGGSYVTHPSTGIDDAGNLYLVFSKARSAVIDTLTSDALNADFNAYLRSDVYISRSTDGGATWTDPMNVSNSLDQESVFPSIQRNVFDGQVHVLWQEDPEVGTSIQDQFDGDGVFDTCRIMHTLVQASDINSPHLTIELPDLDTIDILVGGTYTDPGITFDSCRYSEITDTMDMVNTATVGFYNYTYTALNVDGSTTDVTRVVNVIPADTEAPVITSLLPSAIEACEPFTVTPFDDYTAIDNIDLDVTNDVTVDASAVDVNTPGTYTVTFDVTDNAGNNGNLSVQIDVEDNTAPTITLDSLAGQSANPTYLRLGDTYTEPGANATDCVDGTVSITTSDDIDESTEGEYTVTYEATDAAGNTAVLERTVIVGRAPEAQFQVVQTGPLLVVGDDQSLHNPTDWIWNWGDGTVDSIQSGANQTHLYSTADSFTICLRVRNAFNDAPFNEPVSDTCTSIVFSSIQDVEILSSAKLYPNPTQGNFAVELNDLNAEEITIEVTDAIGTVVATQRDASFSGTSSFAFDLGSEAKGLYFVNIRTEKASATLKVVVE